MKLITKNKAVILAFLILAILIFYSYKIEKNKRDKFETLNRNIASLAETTSSRINQSVVTLPEGNILIGLKNGYATYTPLSKGKGEVEIFDSLVKTHMLRGVYKETSPRLDALVPMSVTGDSYDNGSLYIVLFQDRGNAAIEKSHARLGGIDVSVESIITLPTDGKIDKEEYQVSIKYLQKGIEKELIIPVIDGRFYPDGATSR